MDTQNSVALLSQGHQVQTRIRTIGINPNHWYAVAWAKDLPPGKILPTQLWQQEIALYRDTQGTVLAVEDICPHKGVALHKGKVKGDAIVCPYHGWAFEQGQCVEIPYFPKGQKLPRACARTFPVQEKYGIIFLFPGDPKLAETTPLIDIPQYSDPNWLPVAVGAEFKAHYTICNENTMDVFHGYLHENLQGWFDPILTKLQETDDTVLADYQVSYQGPLTTFLGLSETSSNTTTRTISVQYQYPNYINSLEGISFLYLMRQPIAPDQSRSFSLLFLKVRVPTWLQRTVRPWLEPLIREQLFMKFLRQDIEMIESEYHRYVQDPDRRYTEVNPAIVAVQRLMVKQFDRTFSQ
ncbi:MAG: aromatic ring-hydroxylating dioxygenase subunit alpha [Alkalinema sp. RU_4_3]|nr:aromatic ring-hydroxylating dioxygenase subunit alpha [Alkalinema sp. RU_4_3]